MATDVTMFSPYLAALANPETIPRMAGESVADAQARVQSMQDELVARQSNRGVDISSIDWQQSPGALNAANPTVQTQADYDYWTDRVNKGNAAMPGMGGDLAQTQKTIASLMAGAPGPTNTHDAIMAQQSKDQAALNAGRDAVSQIANGNDFVVTNPGDAQPYDIANYLQASTSPFVTGPGSSSTPTAQTIAAVAPNSQGMLGAGNANYNSALIRSLRQSSVVPFSSNPGVDFYANRGAESSNWTPPVGMGSAFNPQVFNQRQATPQEVTDWNAYNAYRASSVGASQPYLSMTDWISAGRPGVKHD